MDATRHTPRLHTQTHTAHRTQHSTVHTQLNWVSIKFVLAPSTHHLMRVCTDTSNHVSERNKKFRHNRNGIGLKTTIGVRSISHCWPNNQQSLQLFFFVLFSLFFELYPKQCVTLDTAANVCFGLFVGREKWKKEKTGKMMWNMWQ